MKTIPYIFSALLVAGSLGPVRAATPKENVMTAAQTLAGQDNYSWTTTTQVPEEARWRPGPSHGRTAKNGPTYVEMTFGDNTTKMVVQGKNAAVTNRDGQWESLADLENNDGPGRFRALMARNFMTPADQVLHILEEVPELRESEGAYTADLSEENAKALMMYRRRGGGGPEIFDAQGWVKFWLKDGALQKYQYQVRGSMDWNGNDIEIDRTITVEIKDAGTTKIDIPEEAKSKLSLVPVRPSAVRGLTVVP